MLSEWPRTKTFNLNWFLGRNDSYSSRWYWVPRSIAHRLNHGTRTLLRVNRLNLYGTYHSDLGCPCILWSVRRIAIALGGGRSRPDCYNRHGSRYVIEGRQLRRKTLVFCWTCYFFGLAADTIIIQRPCTGKKCFVCIVVRVTFWPSFRCSNVQAIPWRIHHARYSSLNNLATLTPTTLTFYQISSDGEDIVLFIYLWTNIV